MDTDTILLRKILKEMIAIRKAVERMAKPRLVPGSLED